jgi:hypothetical protein
MEVILLTTFFSILFAVLFLLLFLRMRQNTDSCADQDALLPFYDEEIPPGRAVAAANDSTNAKQPGTQDDK